MNLHPIILDSDRIINPNTLAQLRERGGKWIAFQGIAMDSVTLGQLQFIKYGPGCTFETPPEKCPDTAHGLGWKFAPVGFVDLERGTIVDKEVP